jgi:hypothetical protein
MPPNTFDEKPDDAPEDPRREFLVRALQLGLFAGGAGWQRAALADLFGSIPSKLPPGKSIFELHGDVRINGQPAHKEVVVNASDKISVGKGGHAVFAVGDSAFLVRENSDVEFSGSHFLVSGLRLLTGALLSVVGKRDDSNGMGVSTPTVTIGIRGTGFYTEANPALTYFCTCYGVTNIVANADANSTETIKSKHHDAPRYILATPVNGQHIIPAPFINHTDLELATLEALVGREVPFAVTSKSYERPRREEY